MQVYCDYFTRGYEMTTLKYTDDDLKAAIAEVETKSKGLTWVSLNAVSRLLGKQRAAYFFVKAGKWQEEF